jgi:nucleotide-binding universal stress UspA family protein
MDREKSFAELMRLRFAQLEWVTLKGKASEELPYFARQKGNCMMVMGSYGSGGMKRFLKGSTADHLLDTGNILTFVTH